MYEGGEILSKGTITSLHKYPDGHDLLQNYVPLISFEGQKQNKILRAFDSLGEEIFDIVREEILEGESDGWRYSVLEQNEGIPIKLQKESVGKSFFDSMSMYEAFRQELAENYGLTDFSSDQIENIKQEVHYSYDAQRRPVRKIIYQEIDFKDNTLFPDKKLFCPVEESEYHYDDQGRIKAKATFSYGVSRRKRLEWANLYDYQSVGENRVRVTNIGYATVGMRDLQEGAYPLSVVVKDKDITTHAIAGFAAYEDERAVRGEILGNYEFIKKYPRIITYYRRTPKEGMNWPNWQGEPEQVQAASYITEGGYRKFIEGAERTSVGDDPLEENKFEVLYFSEFWERVQAATDEEAIQLAADLLLGKLRVPTIFSYRSAKGKEEADRIILSFVRKAYFISDAKKVAIVTHLLPSYAREIRDGYHRDLDALSREIIEFADLLVRFSKKQRLNFISNYRTTHPDPPDDIALVLDVIEKLENYPTFVTLEPYKSKFKSVLEQ